MTRRVTRVLATLLLVSGCGGGTNTPTAPATPAPAPSPSPTPRSLRGDVTDPIGDTGGSFRGTPLPDLRSGSIEITPGNLMVVSVRCAPGTFDPPTTHIQVALDADENPATGDPFEGLGLEYIINMGSSYYGEEAEVLRFSGDPGYRRVGTVSISRVGDGIDVGIPLSMLGDEDGHLAFRVISSYYLGGNGFTGILDYMPDRGAPGIVVR